MPRKPKNEEEVGPLIKATYWLSRALTQSMLMQADLSTVDGARREQVRSRYYPRFNDAERRLALALEAYGELVRGGDQGRIDAVIAELEVSYGQSRRRGRGGGYRDPIEEREEHRSFRRKLAKLKKKAARLREAGGSTRELRELEQEIKVLEEITF